MSLFPTKPGEIVMFTIFNQHTSDMPGWYVCRPVIIARNARAPRVWPFSCVSKDLRVLRSPFIVRCLTCLGRTAQDDPNIIETWM